MSNHTLTAAEKRAYAELAEWAETNEAAKAFLAADNIQGDDESFASIKKAAKAELQARHMSDCEENT